MMHRRDFLVSAAATLASPIAAKAQQPDGIARVGFLNLGGGEPRMRAAFLQGLRDLGR